MDTLCTKPGDATRTRSVSGSLFAFSLLAAIVSASGCSILFGGAEPCPDTDELCPALECEYGPVVRNDGCAICECEAPPVGAVCWDNSECEGDLICDTDNFCEPPPGCEEGQPCPAVCYGRCSEPTTGCASDADCASDEVCRVSSSGGSGRVADPDDGPTQEPEGPQDAGSPSPCDPSLDDCFAPPPPDEDPPEEPPAPTNGVCVPAGCDGQLDVPACPPGTEPVFLFADDPCGEVQCRVTDDCRVLSPETCENTPGCRLETLPTPCECEPGADCACPDLAELVCVPDDGGCEALGPDECDASPDCEGHFFGGGAAPCFEECDDNTGDCFVACPEPEPTGDEEFICLPRDEPPPPNGECTSDFDCGDGQRCDVTEVCGGVCEQTPDGEDCTSTCEVVGFCVDDPSGTCADRGPATCDADGRCMLSADGSCVPAEPVECFEDTDCSGDEICELTSTCPECNDPNDVGCFAPCWLEGRCVTPSEPPPPPSCETDEGCATGYTCEDVEVCDSTCAAPEPDSDPAPCIDECTVQGQCKWNPDNVTCFFDGDCAEGEFCAYLDNCGVPPDCPNCLIACMGVCEVLEPEPEPVACMDASTDCEQGQICDVENYCEAPPGCTDGLDCPAVCYGRCVDDPNGGTVSDTCLEQADCDEGFRCATEVDTCYCPEGQQCDVCYWQCVEDSNTAP